MIGRLFRKKHWTHCRHWRIVSEILTATTGQEFVWAVPVNVNPARLRFTRRLYVWPVHCLPKTSS